MKRAHLFLAALTLVVGAALVSGQPAANPFTLFGYGANVDSNSGTKSAKTLRVTLATDQVQLTNSLKVDGSGVTQPISAAALPLPSGAATSAKQPALGTAGSASADVISVQGVASMTALKVDGSGVTQPVSLSTVAVTNAGTFATQAAQSGTWTVQPGNTANTTAWKVDGSAVTQPVSIASVPSHAVTNAGTFAVQATLQAGSALAGETAPVTTATTTDAAATCYATSAASTNSTNCKGSAGNIYGVYLINTTTTNYFLRLYNASSAPTCSSATGFIETIPALGAAANGGGISRVQVAQAFATGIGFCLTGGGSSTDNTNAATGVYVTILYK